MDINKIYKEVIDLLKSMKNVENITGMARFGIRTDKAFGISMPDLRKLAKKIGKNHDLATLLWDSQLHEAKILASIVAEKDKVTEAQMDAWIKDFDSWDVCDQVCLNLFCYVPIAYKKAIEWSSRKREFERRAGFALMACLAFKDKKADNKEFEKFFRYIQDASTDERNFVKKAVNWALRQIGKRNVYLNKKAILVAYKIEKINSKSARWIAKNALRELRSEAVLTRLKTKEIKLSNEQDL